MSNKHSFYILSIFTLVCIYLSSCVEIESRIKHPITLNRKEYREAEVFVIYFPYNNAISKISENVNFSSVSNQQIWNIERMNHDIRRMKESNIDGVCVCYKPEYLADPDRREKFTIFLQKCEESGLHALLCLVPEEETKLNLDNVSNYISLRAWDKSPAYYVIDGKKQIGISGNVLVEQGSTNKFKHSYFSVPINCDTELSSLPSPFYLVKSINSMKTFSSDRYKGRALKENINNALTNSRRLLLFSWNNYADGTAIEYNTYDADSLLNVLK